jgi:hypothetical protein
MLKLRHINTLACLALASSLSLSANAANLIAIIASDTLDTKIGASVQADFDHMRQQMQKIANYTGLNLQEILIKEDATTPHVLLQKIKEIKATKDDVIVFYYSGHGFRTQSKGDSPWPNLYFTQSGNKDSYGQFDGEGLKYELVMFKLMEKNPRFLLTMADVCNSFINESYAPPMVNRAFFAAAPEAKIRENYRHLFLDEAGMINLTSAKIGEYAWGGSRGGEFTNAFIDSLANETKFAQAANWHTVIDNATMTVVNNSSKNASTAPKKVQHPYAEVNTKN